MAMICSTWASLLARVWDRFYKRSCTTCWTIQPQNTRTRLLALAQAERDLPQHSETD